MSNPVILITGALTGIGRATALAFAKIGTRLVVSGRRPAEGKSQDIFRWFMRTPIRSRPPTAV
jgi:NAD(P)-dependent dehydrogenase (short-subunit alcohol dehydrogenase family)